MNHAELGVFLKGIRTSRDESKSAVSLRLENALAKHRKSGTVSSTVLQAVDSLHGRRRVDALEKGRMGKLDIVLSDLPLFADGYDVPVMVLAHLASETVSDHPFIQSVLDGFEPLLQEKEAYLGNSRCSIPRRRLPSHDVGFACIEVPPGTTTAPSTHPGEEIVRVMSGKVGFHFGNSGLEVVLEEGDYIHLNSEQPHSLKNTSEEAAEVFVTRRSHLSTRSHRHELNDAITRIRKEIPKKTLTEAALTQLQRVFSETLAPWLFEATKRPIGRLRKSTTLHNELGLAHMVRQLRANQSNPSFRDLERRASDLGEKLGHHALWKLSHGVPMKDVRIDELRVIAKVLDAPLFLLTPFLYPTCPNVVVVRGSELEESDHVRGGNGNSAVFQIPCRSLAGSETSICFVKLEPGAATPFNVHSGYELAMPVSGEVKLQLGKEGAKYVVSASKREFAQYGSSGDHRLVNEGREIARVFVIRFYEHHCAQRDPGADRRSVEPE